MKLLLIIYSGTSPETVPALLESHGASGWTELTNAHGAGSTGRREGTRAWPGGSAVFLTMVDDPKVDDLCRAMREARDRLPDGERLHAAVMPVDCFF